MQHQERKFLGNPQGGRTNADDADFSIDVDETINSENVRWGTTDAGVINTVESIGSTILKSTPLPSVVFLGIGAVDDEENSRILLFKKNTTGLDDKITCFDISSQQELDVIRSAQVTGGLNFSRNSYIHSAWIVNGLLYWVDGINNQPRKINIDAALKANNPSYVTTAVPYTFPLAASEITIIKPPPPLAPNATKDTDGSFVNNFIYNNSFQFTYMYDWYDNERTVVGTYSPSSRLNKTDETFNRVVVTMDALESIHSSVRMVHLVVRFSNSNNAFIVKTWDKLVTSEAAEIAEQNAGTTQLTFNFYNNITGEPIPTSDVLKPFDSVPLYARTGTVAKNRNFLGDNTEGYDTPTGTSLTLGQTTVNIGGSSLNKQLIGVRLSWGLPPHGYSAWYVYLTEVVPVGYYEITSTITTVVSPFAPALVAAPTTVAFSGFQFRGASQAEVTAYVRGTFGNPLLPTNNFYTFTTNIVAITGLSIAAYDIFKTASQYRAGNVFYDFAMRKCGVVTNDGLVFEIAGRDFAFSTGVNGVTWALSNSNALTEIPDWAYYYTPVRTLNLLTRYFVDSFDSAAKYATKNTTGEFVFTSNLFVTGSVGIGLNTTALIQSGLGYVFTDGDVCILTRDDNTTSVLPVIGQQGNYIVVKATDLGDLNGRRFEFEIYTPYQKSDQEPFVETGEMYRIVNPGTSARQYETLTGIFIPDAYVLSRNYGANTYFAEAMSPNDLYYQNWFNDAGKQTVITKLGQARKKTGISFSNVYIPNTAVNGLSTFDALDEKSVPENCGAISRLILTSKVQDEGAVMLAVCANETNSIYLGETQILDATGSTQFIAQSAGVIGTINTLKGSYGSINPESVTEYRGRVTWWDAFNGKIIQYGGNELYPISNFKMTRFWKQFSDQFLSMTTAQIEALGSRPFVFSTVDPHHGELLFSIPKLLNTPPSGYLPDYPSIINPFNIWDGQGKTICYKLENGNTQPHWQGAYAFNPEVLISVNDSLYAVKNGNLYLHNSTSSFCEFYGVQYKPKVMFVSNQFNEVPKVYDNISVESNIVPSFTYLYNTTPYQQASDLVDFDYTRKEGVWYATFYRNKLVPTAIGYNTNGLLTQEKMRAAAMQLMIEFSVTNTPLELKFVFIGFTVSRGHDNLKTR